MSGIAFQFYKETRELLPWWIGGVTAMFAAAFLDRTDLGHTLGVAVLAFGATACGVGALAIGHEYSHRTLGVLLAQPERRGVVLGTKLFVLASLLFLLGVIAFFVIGEGAVPGVHTSRYPGATSSNIVMALGCGFFLAPWLSMVGRGPLPGMLFSVMLPMATFFGVAFALYKLEFLGLEFRLLHRYSLLWLVLLSLWVMGGVLTWTTFLSLQALEGPRGVIRLPAWLTTRPMDTEADTAEVRPRNPAWLYFVKELRLQTMAFALSGIYIALWAAFTLWSDDQAVAGPLAYTHAVVIPVILGATSSAEERHLGTMAWHATLPVSSSWQWTLKAATALTITLTFTAGLPFLLSRLAEPTVTIDNGMMLAAAGLCIGALYISSLSTTGIRAVLTAGLAAIVIVSGGANAFGALVLPAIRLLEPLAKRLTPFSFERREFWEWNYWVSWLQVALAFGGAAILALRFGAQNHLSDDRSGVRIAKQVGTILAYLAVSLIVTGFISQLLWAGLR